jgi:hypothetical protein
MGFTERDIQILRQADVIEFRDDGTTHEIVATLRDRVRDAGHRRSVGMSDWRSRPDSMAQARTSGIMRVLTAS